VSGKPIPAGVAEMDAAIARGILNLVQYIEAQAKQRFQDVGGPLPRPSSAPGESPVVQTGNLRRSLHSVVIWSGGTLGGGEGADYPAISGSIVGYVGTNAGYGLYVEAGTSRMAARPFLTPAAGDGMAKAASLIAAGAK
jgi:hypothetical protein